MGARASGALGPGWPAGLSDHAAWGYSSGSERASAASAWVADGLRIGQRTMYVAALSRDELAAELASVPGGADAAASGALVVVPSTELYDLSAPIDAAAQLAQYAGAVDQALADGYRGLRVAADITPLVLDPGRRAAHLYWEQVADRYMVERPLAPLCLYDTRRIDGIDAIVCAHPVQGPAEPAFALYGDAPRRIALEGEVDAFGAPTLAAMLSCLPETDEVVDLSPLSFIDVRAAWTLHDAVQRRRAAGRVTVLAGASDTVRRLWDLCGFDGSVFAA